MTTKPPSKTFFTPSHLLDNLWLAANGQEDPAVQIYTLKMHRATLANPTITFGTTPSLPFYSLAATNLAGEDAPVQSIINELLIQRHHPTQPRVLPIAQLDLISPPSMDTVLFDARQQETTTLLTSIYPKLAALQALDAAATSPAASRIALVDPGAQSPAAQRLAEDVLAGAAQRECCTLLWTREDPTQAANPWAQHIPSEGTYTLHHPTLGNFPIQLEGDCSCINAPSTRPVTAIYGVGHNMPSTPSQAVQKPASITLLNPYILSTSTPRTNAFSPLPLPPRFDAQNRPISATPSTMSLTQLPTTTDAIADDAVLARLDFANDALVLNLSALQRFGNPFLVDVAASTLCAVAIAEATRGRSSRKGSLQNFDAPPPNDYEAITPETKARSLKDSFARDWEGADARSAQGRATAGRAATSTLRKLILSLKSTTTVDETRSAGTASRATSRARDRNADFDKDIELGSWYGHGAHSSIHVNTTTASHPLKETRAEKKARKAAEKEDRLPFLARVIIGLFTFAFKAVVWVLMLVFKILAGVGKMVFKGVSRR